MGTWILERQSWCRWPGIEVKDEGVKDGCLLTQRYKLAVSFTTHLLPKPTPRGISLVIYGTVHQPSQTRSAPALCTGTFLAFGVLQIRAV